VLFIQPTEPGGYPPLIHAARLMVGAGWDATFLTAPIDGCALTMPSHPRVVVHAIAARPSHVLSRANYMRYAAAAARLAIALRPHVVYASDPAGAGPGLLAARLSRARMVYHEHDSPSPGTLHRVLAHMRRAAARTADVVVFPNARRARAAQERLEIPDARIRIVWNCPLRAELPPLPAPSGRPFIAYYHGGISPERLPEALLAAVLRFGGNVRLRIIGQETPGARGYLAHLLTRASAACRKPVIEFLGAVSREHLLGAASHAHVGISLTPETSGDMNMRHMPGASNKAFDYMAAGLPILVSDLEGWREMFVAPGYARACRPHDPQSIAEALHWFLTHDEERRSMAARARARIEADWNYDTQFAPVLEAITEATNRARVRPRGLNA